MAFTYDITQSDTVSRIRFLIADTNSANHQLEDEEIQAIIDANPSDPLEWLAYEAAVARAGKLDELVSVAAGAVRVSLSDRAKAAHAVIDRLWKLAGKRNKDRENRGRVELTGSDVREIDEIDDDTNRRPNRFRRDQFNRDDELFDTENSFLRRRGLY